ncbi:hypothetical protein GGR51DRAFT_498329 [Nemania sp. FL0031]|nr:hypothetical protein GGR51DRAFT_498329 [Nemania sp. FL0031]
MPPFFGLSQLQTAMTARAVPTLEQLAANPNHLNSSLNNRFERDDPPPYVSSSESEGEEALHHPILALSREAALEKFKDLLSKPLNDNETQSLMETLDRIGVYSPGERYLLEAKREHYRVSDFWRSSFWTDGSANSHVHDLLKGPRGYERRDVIVRHNIRKRWQRLGIWNPEWGIPILGIWNHEFWNPDWGIPSRVNKQPNDNIKDWKWKWQSPTDPPPSDPRHPISRAVQLRKNLAYGEHAPPPPRSHLRDDSSASEAESFIISRPWFIFEIEKFEFRERDRRIPVEQSGFSNPGEDGETTKRWKERGDWFPTWKWRHESPSPEPEDLTPLNTDAMDFTPSEVDALETIPPTSPPRPEPIGPEPTGPEWAKWGLFADGPSGAADELEDQAVQEVEGRPLNPPQQPRGRPRGRPRQQPQPADVAAAPPPPPQRQQQQQRRSAKIAARNANPPPSPRRSARIAARNANPTPPPPPKAAGRTRTRMPRGPPAAPSPRNAPSVADAPKKRGRPRKTQDDGITKPAAPTSKRARRPSGRAAAVAASAARV